MFWKLLLAEIFVLAVLWSAAVFLFCPWLDAQLLDRQEASLRSFGQNLAGQLEARLRSTPWEELAQQWNIVSPQAPLAISLLSADEVARESANNPPNQDLLDAAQGRPTFAVRSSATDANRSLRWAQPLRQGDLTAGVLVISRSSGDIDAVVSQTKRIFLITAIMTGLAGAAAAALIAGRWSRHFAAMRQAVSHLTFDQEKPPSPLAAGSADELQRMAKSVEETRDKIDAQIRGIDQVRRDLQSMLETIPEAVIAIDADQRILFANPSTHRLFGLPATDIAGKKLWAILRQPGLQDAVSRSLATSDQVTTEFEIRNPPRVVSFRGRNLNIGSGRGVIIVLQDVTELRRLERMRRDFFASVSHELKTPLAAIKAYTETLLDDDTGDRNIIERFLHRIEEQADRLHTLVIDMLTLARVESEDHGFDIRPIEVAPTLAASVELFRAEADGKSLRFETHIAPAVILADAEGFGMIVRNLIDNAVKYTPVGGTVTVSSVVDGDSIRIDVADTGVGIPPEDLTRIFERFYRVDKARSRELGGTGLGLSIVKHLVQQFCGTVSVTSRLHEGSVFTVSLPLLEESDESRDQPTTLVQESAS